MHLETGKESKNHRTDHLIFATPWSSEWGVPHSVWAKYGRKSC